MQRNKIIKEKKLNQEELLSEIARLKKELKKKKKYGLVWEEKKEDVVEMCKDKLPVLVEDKSKAISETGEDDPVNILIEGDNYHALSALNYTHEGKIDVIYIDPPYNTGKKDFKYNDRWVEKEDSYRHSMWINHVVERLKLSRTLLKNSGVIFISIDDNEMAQLKLICDDVMRENNFIANIIWKKRSGPPNDQIIGTTHEYILGYAKNLNSLQLFRKKRDERNLDRYKNPDNHPKGVWAPDNLMANVKGGRYVKSLYFAIENPFTGEKHFPSSKGNWRFNENKIKDLILNNAIYFGKDNKGRPKLKRFLSDVKDGLPFSTNWDHLPHNNAATAEIMNLFGSVNIFDTPKPSMLIKEILTLSTNKKNGMLILDFYAGSGTTGQAVLELNKEDDGNRKFILVTNNENKICTEVCYPRVRKVIKGYKNLKGNKVKGLGGNLRYYKTEFVDAKQTDKNKKLLTEKSTDMLCIKEDTYDEIKTKNKHFKIFKRGNKYTGIIYDYMEIEAFKEFIKKIDGKFSVYIFSLGDDTFDEEFEDIGKKVKLSPIPEAIMRVYRRVFK